MKPAVFLVALLLACSAAAGAGVTGDRVALEQHLGTALPLQQRFVDERGRPVRLGDYFGQRPVALAFAYYECPNLCDTVLSGVFQGLQQTGYTAGEDYELVVVGIAPGETPAQAAYKKSVLLGHHALPGAGQHVHFLTGHPQAIRTTTQAAGFRYYYDSKLKQYAHAAGMLIATPDGRLSRYLYGVRFVPRDLRLALLQADKQRIGSPVDQLLLLCFHYDPKTGRYGVLIMNVLRLAAGLVVLMLGGLVWWMLRRERRPEDSA